VCCEPQNLGVVPDEPHALEESIRSAAEDCSVLKAVRSCGFEVLFHGVAVKPGKPLLSARKGDGARPVHGEGRRALRVRGE
jgi:molybdopterin biosynthesis enzyme